MIHAHHLNEFDGVRIREMQRGREAVEIVFEPQKREKPIHISSAYMHCMP